MAVLHARGRAADRRGVAAGEHHRQPVRRLADRRRERRARFRTFAGSAFVTGEATLRFDPADPFRLGIGGP